MGPGDPTASHSAGVTYSRKLLLSRSPRHQEVPWFCKRSVGDETDILEEVVP